MRIIRVGKHEYNHRKTRVRKAGKVIPLEKLIAKIRTPQEGKPKENYTFAKIVLLWLLISGLVFYFVL